MASAALPPTHPPPPPSHNTPPESPLSRMNHHHQFFNTIRGESSPGSGGPPPPPVSGSPPGPPSSNNNNNHDLDSYGAYNSGSDPYYQEASATSGSNSADEEDLPPGSKRSLNGGHLLNSSSASNKKRRKQSKPLRLGELSNEENSSRMDDEDESARRYSTEDEEGEVGPDMGQRRPSSSGDSPLNLSSGSGSSNNVNNSTREPGEKGPSLRVLGPELMSSPDFESGELISKLGGLPPNSSAAATSLYQAAAAGMLPFGLGGHFPFPFPPKSGLVSPGGPRTSQIFNPEAYCELCNKEFCNKYFLKTHKANKHGIYTDPPPPSSISSSGPSPSASETPSSSTLANNHHGPNPSSGSAGSNNNNNNNSINGSSKSLHHPPISSSSQSGSPFSGAFIAANMGGGGGGALRPPFMPLSPPSHSSPSPACKMDERGPSSPGVRSNNSSSANENGELRRSLESPLGRLPPGISGNMNSLMFGGSKDHSDRIPTKSNLSQDKLRQMGVINADAFCEICCKEFCNKYFLRVHKLKKHGICSPDLPPEKVQKILSQMAKEAGKTGQAPPQLVRPSSSSSNPVSNNATPMIPPPSPKSPHHRPRSSNTPSLPPELSSGLKEKDVIHIDDSCGSFGKAKQMDSEEQEEGELIKKSSSEDLQRLQSMIMELNAGKGDSRRSEDESSVCKICSKDMENKLFLRAHLMNEHGIMNPEDSISATLNNNPFLSNGFLDNKSSLDFTNKFLQQMTKGFSQSEEERHYLERVKNELASGSLSPRKLLDTSKDPNRRPASLSRSYCEICKKELCNKYFMKTHMMKMHGINIDGGGPGSSPGLSGVSCHICKKELCSKYFLKVHLQNSHGLNEDGLPLGTPPPAKENGSSSSLFPSLFPPPPPEFPDKDSQYFSRLLGEQSEKLKQQAAATAAAAAAQEAEKLKASNSEEAPFTCPFCGEDMKELVLLQVHIIRTHGAFPPDTNAASSRREGLFSSSSSSRSHHRREEEDTMDDSQHGDEDGDEQGMTSSSSKNNAHNDSEEDRKSNSEANHHHHRMESTNDVGRKSPKTPPRTNSSSIHDNHPPPSKASPSSSLSSNEKAPGSSPPESNFPNIEMLQRHMLSTQFPGLINPLLSAGFPGLSGGSLSFPIQKLLSGSPPMGSELDNTPPSSAMGERKKNTSEGPKGGRRRIYKCPKCNQKFKRRELCLSHLTEAHGLSIRRKLRFSPLKGGVKKNHRSEYVRHFMELLKFPTSRATPKTKSEAHIMQPFLLKTPSQQQTTQHQQGDEEGKNEESEEDSGAFVPSLIYLPVARRVSGPLTVAFNLIPA